MQIKSLDKMIAQLEANLEKLPSDKTTERDEVVSEIDLLKEKRQQIISNPDILGMCMPVHFNQLPLNRKLLTTVCSS